MISPGVHYPSFEKLLSLVLPWFPRGQPRCRCKDSSRCMTEVTDLSDVNQFISSDITRVKGKPRSQI